MGKSTLFNALVANAKAEAANFPFCTIEPNVGVVSVPDERLEVLAKISNSEKIVPTRIEFVDIAGLVKGASRGEGLGNQFLANIREVDAIVHVVRCFDNDDIIHVSGSVDPARDIEVINLELALADLGQVEKRVERLRKQAKNSKEAAEELAILEKILICLNDGISARKVDLSKEEEELIKNLGLLSRKPIIYAANVSEDDLATGNDWVESVRQIAQQEQAKVVIVSAQVESELVGGCRLSRIACACCFTSSMARAPAPPPPTISRPPRPAPTHLPSLTPQSPPRATPRPPDPSRRPSHLRQGSARHSARRARGRHRWSGQWLPPGHALPPRCRDRRRRYPRG